MKATLAFLLLALAILAWAPFQRPQSDISRDNKQRIVHSEPTIEPENPVFIKPLREPTDY